MTFKKTPYRTWVFKRSDLVCGINHEQRVSGTKFVLRPPHPTPTEMQLHGPFRGRDGVGRPLPNDVPTTELQGEIKGRRNAIWALGERNQSPN
ncbi:hypothetical protein CEXT_764201 [Caerostris extrusa]|uniref:Uncharacterized protein n=1 Tax=Caerostris extrusa TaxID=172846 RepID=A0AAV4X6E2_CAEEX|nr:hypothetical protein CEXT_764201 [Caerostris extrusa]